MLSTFTKNNEYLTRILESVNPRMGRIFMPFLLKNPGYLKHSVKLAGNFEKSEEIRKDKLDNGIMVPPIMIFSITHMCNLTCGGCFASALGSLEYRKDRHMSLQQWKNVIEQSVELGVFAFLIAGGEPFMFEGLLDIVEEYEENLFVIFTNGTAINEDHYKRLKKLYNVVVIVSIEGDRMLTDSRRGTGVFDKALESVKKLGKCGVLSGISVTVNRVNADYWSEESNIDYFVSEGIKILFLTEYIPTCDKNEEKLLISQEERAGFRETVLKYKRDKNILIIHSPGDEEIFGGCVSAGKGFAHVNSLGDLTPCPVSDIATHNLKNHSLEEGLKSVLFTELRENGDVLEKSSGPCALFENRVEVEKLRKKVGAYKTNS